MVELPLTYGRIGMNEYANQLREEAKRLSQAYLAAVAQRLTHGGVPSLTVTTSLAVNLDVSQALVQVVQQELLGGGHFDLVAMATHGRSGLQRLLMGSVTDHVMSATKLPMLVVHPSGQRKQAHASDKQRVGVTR